MHVDQEARSLAKARSTNSTDASYTARGPQTAAPANTTTGFAGVVLLANGPSGEVSQNLLVLPYVLGANNATFSVRVVGWTLIPSDGTLAALWVPNVLAEYDCTGSAAVGVAASMVLDTERMADTLAKVALMGTDGQGTTLVSPADDTPGHFLVKTNGCQRVEFQFKKGTGTSANALYRAF